MPHRSPHITAPAPPEGVRVSDTAVRRYVDRVKPGLDELTARNELEHLVEHVAHLSDTAPAWARDAHPRTHYLLVGDAIVLPLAYDHKGDWAATDCLTSGRLTDRERRARNAARPRRRTF